MNDLEKPDKPLWNSLEIAKIAVGILTPAAIFFFTYQTNRAQSEYADTKAAVVRQETHERERFVQVTKQRIALWSEISPLMNDLYCYFLYVGHWKDISPGQAITIKRKLDKLIYSNSPFFSPSFLAKYNSFMSSAFKTGNGWGEDAKLKSPPIRKKDKGKEYMFVRDGNNFAENTESIHNAYFDWLAYAAKEMDLEVKAPPKPPTPTAAQIQEHLND